MRSPLKDPHNFRCAPALSEILPAECTVKSFAFLSGQMEFALMGEGRKFTFLTNKIAIYDFWKHAFDNPYVVARHAAAMHENTTSACIDTYRKDLLTYREPHMRAAIFYLLNRYSDRGNIFSGTFNMGNYSPLSTRYLKNLKSHDYELELFFYPENYVEEGFKYLKDEDLVLLPIGPYKPSLLITGVSEAYDEYAINTNVLDNALEELSQPFAICYHYDSRIPQRYKKYNIAYTTKHGNLTRNERTAHEAIITNF